MSELGEGSASAGVEIDPDKYLKVKVTKITFNKTYKACRSRTVITGHHWPAGKPDGYRQSKKAAVLQLGKDKKCTANITVNVDSKGMSGKGIITGTLNGLTFIGEVPLANGVHENIEVTLKETPDALSWTKGAIHWEVDAKELAAIAGRTRVELFFVFDDPANRKFFKGDGVWIEALRFIFKKGRLEGATKVKQGLARVTKGCFELKENKYEILSGEAKFGGTSPTFRLTNYMKPAPRQSAGNDFVNCYDQTYAVIVFSGAIGLTMKGLFLQPFGYLKLTELVGKGRCNNPFPTRKFKNAQENYLTDLLENGTSERNPPILEDFLVVDAKDHYRSAFGNHMFCEYKAKIYDACAGPAIGSEDSLGYLLENIDINTPNFNSVHPTSRREITKNQSTYLTGIDNITIRGQKIKLEIKNVE